MLHDSKPDTGGNCMLKYSLPHFGTCSHCPTTTNIYKLNSPLFQPSLVLDICMYLLSFAYFGISPQVLRLPSEDQFTTALLLLLLQTAKGHS